MGILSQTAGSTCEFWTNPVFFTLRALSLDAALVPLYKKMCVHCDEQVMMMKIIFILCLFKRTPLHAITPNSTPTHTHTTLQVVLTAATAAEPPNPFVGSAVYR